MSIRAAIADLDGMRLIVALLSDSIEELKCLAAETIAQCAKNGILLMLAEACAHLGTILSFM